MNINEVHWTCSNNVTNEHPKSRIVNFSDFSNHLQFFDAVFTAVLMRMQSFMFVFLSILGSLNWIFTIDTFLLCTQ